MEVVLFPCSWLSVETTCSTSVKSSSRFAAVKATMSFSKETPSLVNTVLISFLCGLFHCPFSYCLLLKLLIDHKILCCHGRIFFSKFGPILHVPCTDINIWALCVQSISWLSWPARTCLHLGKLYCTVSGLWSSCQETAASSNSCWTTAALLWVRSWSSGSAQQKRTTSLWRDTFSSRYDAILVKMALYCGSLVFSISSMWAKYKE